MFLPLVTEVAGAVGELPVALITLDVVHEAVLPGVFGFVVRPQGLDLGRHMVTQLAEYLHRDFQLGMFVLVGGRSCHKRNLILFTFSQLTVPLYLVKRHLRFSPQVSKRCVEV